MTLGVRGRIFLTILGLTAAIGLAAGALLEIRLRTDLLQRVEGELQRSAEVLDAHLASLPLQPGVDHIDDAVDRIAGPADLRMTVVAADGVVLGESSRDGEALASMDNHASRPEVIGASKGGWGLARRRSDTVNADMLYVARQAQVAGERVTIRVGKPLSEVDAAVWSLRLNLLLSAALALGAALVSATFVSRWMQGTLERLVDQAQALSDEPDPKKPTGLGTRRASVDELSAHLEGALKALASERDHVRSLERVRKDFVTNVSHELRTPIAIVAATTETLLDGAIDNPEAARPFTEAAHRQAVRLGRMVDELLALSRLEAGGVQVHLQQISLRPVLEHIVRLHAAANPDRPSAQIDVPDELTAWVDRQVLEHAIGNLVENAMKYVPAEAPITVRADLHDDRVWIEVIDEGPGIAPEHRDRVFERFYRVDAGRSREVGGTGLGLSLVRHLCEAMGARVSLHDNEPSGCVFRVDVPASGPASG